MKKLLIIVCCICIGVISAQKRNISDEIKLLDLSEWQIQIQLEEKLEENSGIQWVDGFIYSFNDSGGAAEIYKVSPETGKILQTIQLKKVDNIDFEDIAFDGKNLYVGDFGNNAGKRRQKFIYVFNVSKIKPDEPLVELKPKKMVFEIDEENIHAVEGAHTTDFDIEALVYYEGQLHFFTKEWTSAKTTHYTLDPKYAYQSAKKQSSFNAQSFITSADIYNNTLLLTGYTKEGEVFLYQFKDFEGTDFFSGTAEKYMLGLSPAIGQIEGITIDKDRVFISGERISMMGLECPQKLYQLSLSDLK